MKFTLNQISFFTLFIIVFMNCSDKKQNTTSSNLSRHESALSEKEKTIIQNLNSKNIDYQEFELFLRAFKSEEVLEVWAKNPIETQFQKIIEYPFCVNSGILGPKRIEGDQQIPEGVYHINRFNDKSKFHLSLGLNYPNRSDRFFADKNRPGSDIFIHGGCSSVGCISITDDKIKELWVLTSQAKLNGQVMIEVHIFPMKITEENLKRLIKKIPKHQEFWENLQHVFEYFEKKKEIPKVRVNDQSRYYNL